MADSHSKHSQGVDIVSAELTRRRISHALGRKRGIDLHVTNASRGSVSVKVKMKGPRSVVWQDHIETEPTVVPPHESAFYVFVDKGDEGTGPDRFWIVPFLWMRNNVYETHKRWIERIGGRRPNNADSEHHSIELPRIEPWRDRWDLLTD